MAPLLRRGLTHDAAHVGDEAHGQHAVRFVQHQLFHLAQVQLAPGNKVDEAPRGAHENIDPALLENAALALEVHAPHHGQHPQPGEAAKALGVVGNLQGELPGWGHDEGPRRARRQERILGEFKLVGDDRDKEGGGFSRPRLRLPHHVIVGEGVGERFPLNRGAGGEAEGLDGLHEGAWQPELFK